MSNLLQQLDNDQAILLMYLAGELPEEDRVEVEQRLVNDALLRAAMADLAALQAGTDAALAGERDIAPARRESAVRRVVRVLAAAHEERLTLAAAATPQETARRLRLAWWAYPVAAAAILLVGIIIMSNSAPGKLDPSPEALQIAAAVEASTPTPRILDQAEDPALDRLDVVEKQMLSLHTPEEGLFQVDSSDADR
jgi:anti-sigma factor RsiW